MATLLHTHLPSIEEAQIKIGQINTRHCATAMKEVNKLVAELQLDIICLQEPYSRRGKIPYFPPNFQIASTGEHPMSAIIVANRNIHSTLVTQFSDEWATCLEIKSFIGTFILVSLYFQYRDRDIQPYLNRIRLICNAYRSKRIILTADANAKSTLWDSPITDKRGDELVALIMELNLEIVNQPGHLPTFCNETGAEAFLDVTLATKDVIHEISDWRVGDGLTVSDHNLILFSIGGKSLNIMKENENHYNLSKTNWEKTARLINPPEIYSGCNIDDIASQITANIQEALSKSTPKIRSNKKNGNTNFWNMKLENLRQDMRIKRRKYQKCRDLIIRQEKLLLYREAKEKYELEIKNVKITKWEKFVNENLKRDPWGLPYKIMMEKIKSPTVLRTLVKENGESTTGWTESVEYLMDKLLPNDDEENETEIHRTIRRKLMENYDVSEEAASFTPEEISKVINSLARRKAAGPDGIKNEVLQKLDHKLTPWLTNFYNECLKQGRFPKTWKKSKLKILKKGEDRDPTKTGSYRPICLINTMGKLLERMIVDRLNKHREKVGYAEQQFGFTKGKSTEDAINRLIEHATNTDSKYTIILFADVSGAFDNLWWPSLFTQLRKLRCPKNIYKILENYCEDRIIEIQCYDEQLIRKSTKGCPQGSVCGPNFWNITLEPLLHKLTEMDQIGGVVAYADDIAFVVHGNNRNELESKTNQILCELDIWCKNNKLNLSKEKTTYMLVRGSLQRNPTIKMDSTSIKRVKVAKYLGIQLDEKLNFHNHIDYVKNKSIKIMNKIISIGQSKFHLPLDIISRYHEAIMTPITSYAASAWAHRLHNVTNAAKLNSAQRSVLLRLTGAFATTPGDGLTAALGLMPMHIKVLQKAANYWINKGNLIRASEIVQELVTNRQDVYAQTLTLWQRKWDTSVTGRRVHALLPCIRERLQLRHLKPKKGLIHFLTGHGPYKETLSRFALVESPVCGCNESNATPEHVIWSCKSLERELQDLRKQLQNRDIYQIIRNPKECKQLEILAEHTSELLRKSYIQSVR